MKKEGKKILRVDVNVFVCVGNEMFEGVIKLNGRPKNGDNFPASGTMWSCRNQETEDGIDNSQDPIIAELSALNQFSIKDVRARLLDCGFMQVEESQKNELFTKYAVEMLLVESTES
jgi:hypothetical protein